MSSASAAAAPEVASEAPGTTTPSVPPPVAPTASEIERQLIAASELAATRNISRVEALRLIAQGPAALATISTSDDAQVTAADYRGPAIVAGQPLPWHCAHCTFENPADRTSCEMCGNMQAPSSGGATSSHQGPGAVAALPLSSWICNVCTFENPADATSCEMCGQMHSDAPATGGAAGSSGGGFLDAAEAHANGLTAGGMSEILSPPPPPHPHPRTALRRSAEDKRREIIERQRRNKASIDTEVVEHFKEQEAHRGLVAEAFECSCCMDDVEAYAGIRCAPGHPECEHKMCSGCFARLVEGQIEKKESLVCPLCPANRPAQIPSWLAGLVVGEQAQAQLVEIEQLHLSQVGGGTLRLWQCPTPDCQNRLALDPDWDARIAVKRQVFGVGLPPSEARGATTQTRAIGARRLAPLGPGPALFGPGPAALGPGRRLGGGPAALAALFGPEVPPPVEPRPEVPQKVPDTAFTASTQRPTHCAHSARLHHTAGWLPFGEETGWLEVDLGEDVRLLGLAIQGGFLGTVSIRPRYDVDWTPCSYVVPHTQDPDHIVDIECSPVAARFLRFDAEEFIGEAGLRFEVYVTDAPEGVSPLSEQERVVCCTACEKKICVRCMVEDHAGITCEAFARWKAENESGDSAYADMVAQGLIKPCPNCNAPILKTEGCNYMTCVTCNDRHGMCWETGKKRYGPTGCGGGHNCH